ncbi:MAG TPA: NAD-dependent epimerase/dehydratase family protein [Opitutaceae bacterium]|jgi:UDP-glucose 4-epimerase
MKIFTEGSRVLVTGGAGFIGSHLVDQLIDSGCFVTVLDNFRNGRRENLARADLSGRLRVVEADVTDSFACNTAIGKECSAVFHLACLGVRHSLHSPMENHHVNATGTLEILEASRRAGVGRFIYMSTSEVYGAAPEFPLKEDSPTWPTTVYGASKLAGEHYSAAYQGCFGLPVIRVRPFNNYGARAHFHGDSGEVIPRFILRTLAGEAPVIFGDGTNTRDFLYVKDCAAGLLAIAECDGLIGEVVNLGYGEETTISDLAELILETLGRSDLKPVHDKGRPGDVPRLKVDSAKLVKKTGFIPRTKLADGLRLAVEHYCEIFRKDPDCLSKIQSRNWEIQ